MLDIEIISLISMKDIALKQLTLEYEKRLKPFAKLKQIEIKPSAFKETKDSKLKAQFSDEAKLTKLLLVKDNVFLLSEEGTPYNSLQLTRFLYQNETKKIVLVIGNTLGFSADFKKKYQLLSLSPLTLPHQLAKLVLVEQIYRSVCINTGKDYHY